MKYRIYIIMMLSFLVASCTNDDFTEPGKQQANQEIKISLRQTSINEIISRANLSADSKLEHVILFAFDKTSGNLITRYEQDLNYPNYDFRMTLPVASNMELHAVCNTSDTWFDNVTGVSDLNNKVITIESADDVFTSSMIMYGKIDVTASQTNYTITVQRLGAKINMNINFTPQVSGDKLYLTRITAYNLPSRSYLIARTWDNDYTSAQSDAVYYADANVPSNYYIQDYLLDYTSSSANSYSTTFYMYENRRGGLDDSRDWFDRISDKNPNKASLRQIFKREYGDSNFPAGTYVIIEGTYVSDNGSTTQNAKYKIYLGANNYSDFNIKRNSNYTYTISIRSGDDKDTRVDMEVLDKPTITSTFNNPMDAHCSSLRCFGFSQNDWELYVENPDATPWLEVSFFPQYKPYLSGTYYKELATTSISDTGPLYDYFYIHLDEYIPENATEWTGTQDPGSFRTGYVVLKDKTNGTTTRLEVQQRPAQYIRVPVKDLSGNIKSYNEYFVEYELEKKNMQWGFLKYPDNPVMTGMMDSRWDGLANTQTLYEEATRRGGMYNPDGNDPSTIIIPEDIALGYVISKNRDRNGNGYIDADDIEWYLPAADELVSLSNALKDYHITFDSSNNNFYSSTPFLPGFTEENPGRAFYVRMNSNEKGFTMRNRYYNVISCRRIGTWTSGE